MSIQNQTATSFMDGYAKRAADFLSNPAAFSDDELWAVVRSTNCHTELNCRVVSQAKAELRRRGTPTA